MKKRVTIKDVALQAGVSHQTVSRVINNLGHVTPTTRQRVEQAIVGLNFRPSSAARTLSSQRTHVIGLIIPYQADYLITDPNLLAQISGIDAEAHLHGYDLLLATAGLNPATSLVAYQRFSRHQIADGALVIETASAAQGNLLLTQQELPYICLGYDDHVWCVHADDWQGAYQATRHLLNQGHQRIGVINGPAQGAVLSMAQRLAGHQAALHEVGLRFEPALVVYGDYTRLGGQRATEQLLALDAPPTAIFALNDRMAMGAVWAVQAAGKRVPQDVAVMGFDDIPAAADFSPALTTVHLPSRDLGQIAARGLFKLLAGDKNWPREVVLPTQLVIRRSA